VRFPAAAHIRQPSTLVTAVLGASPGPNEKDIAQPNCQAPSCKAVIDRICDMPWETINNDEIMRIAKAYYYFSIQFRENLVLACAQHPNDLFLKELYKAECNTDNLSPYEGITRGQERINHDEFLRRLLCKEFHEADQLDDLGHEYLCRVRSIDITARVASIATYEDGGLSRVFASMLRAPRWLGAAQRAFRFFLEEHIRFDTDSDCGHGALTRNLKVDDSVLPLWEAFEELLQATVSELANTPLHSAMLG
jgi:hypothetical protein